MYYLFSVSDIIPLEICNKHQVYKKKASNEIDPFKMIEYVVEALSWKMNWRIFLNNVFSLPYIATPLPKEINKDRAILF